MQPGNNLLRHTEKMLIAASFRIWRDSHPPVAQGRSQTAKNSEKWIHYCH